MLQLTFNPGLTLTGFRTTRPRTEQTRTKLSLFPRTYSEIVVPFPFKLTYNCSKTTRRVAFMQKIQANCLLRQRQKYTVEG